MNLFAIWKMIAVAVRAMIVMTVLTGVVYPLMVTVLAQALFSTKANGSLVTSESRGGKVIGSSLFAQKMTKPGYFMPRPSAADFATVPSGASNLGPTSQLLRETIAARRQVLGLGAPEDLVTASASGLDPDISPEAAFFQSERVANERRLSLSEREELRKIINNSIEDRLFGFLGSKRVNVLRLNLAVEGRWPGDHP